MNSSGQMIGDTGRHASRHNSGKVSGHNSAKEESTVIRNRREGRMKLKVRSLLTIPGKKQGALESNIVMDLSRVLGKEEDFAKKKKAHWLNSVTHLSRVFCKEAASKLEEGLQHGGVLPQACQNDSRVQSKGLHVCPLSPAADFRPVTQLHCCCDCENARSMMQACKCRSWSQSRCRALAAAAAATTALAF